MKDKLEKPISSISSNAVRQKNIVAKSFEDRGQPMESSAIKISDFQNCSSSESDGFDSQSQQIMDQ